MIAMKHINNRSAGKSAIYLRIFILSLLLLGFSSTIYAANFTWTGSGDGTTWTNSGNWNLTSGTDDGSNGYPDGEDNATINATITLTGTIGCTDLTVSGGTVTLGANGSFQNDINLSGGTINTNGNNLIVSQTINVSGGTLILSTGAHIFTTLSLSSGTVNANSSEVLIGSDISYSGGTFNPGTSTFNFNNNSGNLTIASTNGDIAFYNLSRNPSFLSGGLTIDITGGSNQRVIINSGGTFTAKGKYSGMTLTNGSFIYQSNTTLSYEVGADVSVSNEWPTSNRPHNVIINTPNSSTEIELTSTRSIDDDLTISSGVLTTSGTFNISLGGALSTGTLTTTGSFTNTSGTSYIVMTGGENQTITGGAGVNSIENLRIDKDASNDVVTLSTGILKIANSLDVQTGILELSTSANQLDIQGADFEINANGEFRSGGKTIVTNGSTTYNFANSSTFVYNGSTTETTIEDAQYGNLTVNNSNGLNISGDVSINGTLTFSTNALIDVTGSNTLTLASGASVSGQSANRYVDGPLRRIIGNTTATSFPIGTSSAYRPAVFQYDSAPGSPQTIEMEYDASNPGGNLPTGISQIATGGHYLLQNITGTSTPNYGLTLRYTDAGISPENRTRILVQNGSGPDYSVPSGQTHDTGNDNVTATGITALPTDDFYLAFGQGGATTTWLAAASTSDWATAGNWDNGVPTSVDDAVIQSSSHNPEIGSGDAATVNTLNIQSGASLTFSDGSDIEVTSTGSGALTVAGTFTINTNAKVDFNNSGYNTTATTLTGTVIYGASSSVQPDTYANLQVNGGSGNASGTTTVTGNYTNTSGSPSFNNLDIAGDMILTAGSPSGTIEVEGDISSSGGNVGGTVTMNGTSAQTISGNFTFNNLTINNSSGVALSSGASPTINGALTLTSGVLDASTGTSLTLLNSTSGGDNNSYINGLVTIQMSGTTNPYAIATGDNELQRTIAIIPADINSTEYEVEFFEGDLVEPDVLQDPPLQAVSDLYHWSVERTSGGTNAQITLYYDKSNDGISSDASIRVARYESSGSAGWFDQGPTTNGAATSVTSNSLTVYAQRYYTVGTSNASDNPLPVELMSFEGTSTQNGIALNWETASEKDSRGFILSRRSSSQDTWQVVSTYAGNSALEATNSLSGASYSYLDNIELQAGQSVEYQLEEEDIAGIRVVLESITVESQYNTQIQGYSLTQNYPNPFNPSTTIGYELKDNAKVNIVVYNALGQAVQTLVNENQSRGKYNVQFNAGDLSSGIYFYRMIVSGANQNFTDVRKMMLVK